MDNGTASSGELDSKLIQVTWQPHFENVKPLSQDGLKLISPVLFVDGHAAVHDFSEEIRRDPQRSFEETKDWIWCKAEPQKPTVATNP